MTGGLVFVFKLTLIFLSGVLSRLGKKASSPFQEVLKSSMFVDKTLLLKEVFLEKSFKLVTAPNKFGKSVNLDMIKRFLEIEVEENGHPKNLSLTENYKLFMEHNLNIFKEDRFFNEHFGKHPVIFVNYSHLINVNSHKDMLEKFQEVVSETFLKHHYLIKNATLWSNKNEMNYFKSLIAKTYPPKVLLCLRKLSKLLANHFGKTAYVLMDSCDAVTGALMFNENSAMLEITKFIWETDRALLNNNSYISGAFLTGALRVYGNESGIDVKHYQFLEDHEFSQFYGLTETELDALLDRTISDKKIRTERNKSIKEYYNGYLIYSLGGLITIYPIWSVMYFLMNNEHPKKYLCKEEYVKGFKVMVNIHIVNQFLKFLLSKKSITYVHVELREPVFDSRTFILNVNFIIKNPYDTDSEGFASCVFLTILYYLGFLTPNESNMKTFKLPNKEAHNELNSYMQGSSSRC